ncbi:hypothetical protein Tco_0019055 [Tanacetum coccineum]
MEILLEANFKQFHGTFKEGGWEYHVQQNQVLNRVLHSQIDTLMISRLTRPPVYDVRAIPPTYLAGLSHGVDILLQPCNFTLDIGGIPAILSFLVLPEGCDPLALVESLTPVECNTRLLETNLLKSELVLCFLFDDTAIVDARA